MSAAGKLRQKWLATAATKVTKPWAHLLAKFCTEPELPILLFLVMKLSMCLYTMYLFAIKVNMIYLVSTVHKLKFQVGAALPLRRQRGRVRQLQGLLPQGRPERQQQVSGP